MKKQFYRVKQLADQTFNRGEKSEILNHEELQIADQKIEYLRNALLAINKKITPTYPAGETEKHMKKTLEYQIGSTFLEESKNQQECLLFQTILKESGVVEQLLARDYVDYESKVEELVYNPFHQVLENELPNILKLKHNLRKYCLDKDSASNRYHATGKEAIKEDLEEADTKVEQSRDALATEMFNVLAKENEFSEYILQFLKLQRIYHESALKNLQNLIPQLEKKIGDSPVRKVFGTSLKEHLRITGKRIAYPLEICITALSEEGMSEEGLFRVAASTIKVKRLKSSIDSGCFSHLIPEYKDVHVLASLLKLYLRELPEPLLTFHLHKDWIDAAQIPEIHRLGVVKDIISKLPQENKDNLAYLFQFLSRLTKHKENKMNPSNIAIVLSPNLLWNKHENLNVNIGNCVTINILVELLIREVEVLFPDDASKYVTISDIFHYDDSYGFKTSNTNLAFSAESPRPNLRKKKAPIPPPINLNKSQISSVVENSPNSKNKQIEKLQTSVDVKVQTGDSKSSDSPNKLSSTREQVIPQPVSKSETIQVIQKPPVQSKPEQMQLLQKSPLALSPKPEPQAQKPPIGVSTKPDLISVPQKTPVTKTNRETMTENFINMNKVQPMPLQNRTIDQKFTTTAVHKVNQPVIYDKNDKNKTRNNSDSIEETQLRRKDPSMKPEVPARPSSLSVRPSNDIDPMLKRTQCSVYNVANKQQPSIINIQSSQKELYQPGHDTQMAEKEKFLGHKAQDADNKESNPTNMNLNVSCPTDVRSRSYSDANKLVSTEREVVDTKKLKSNEELNKSLGSSSQLNCDNNGNQKSSHTRARSDGGVIDLEKGQSLGFHSSRTLSKPTEPPPPPPEKM